MRPPPMTAMRPDPSAAWSTIWKEAPFADAVYTFCPTTPFASHPAGITLYVPAMMGTRMRGRFTISPRARAANSSSSTVSVSSMVRSSPIWASVR